MLKHPTGGDFQYLVKEGTNLQNLGLQDLLLMCFFRAVLTWIFLLPVWLFSQWHGWFIRV